MTNISTHTRIKTSWASRSLAERANAYFQVRVSGSLLILLAMFITQIMLPAQALQAAITIVLLDIGVLVIQRVFINQKITYFLTWLSLLIAALIGSIGIHLGGGVVTLSIGVYMILILAAALVFLSRKATFLMFIVCAGIYGTMVFLEFTQILPAHNKTFNIIYISETRLFLANTLLGVTLLIVTMLLSGKAAESLGQWGIQLENEVERKNAELNNALESQRELIKSLEKAYDSTLEGWAKILEMRDKETEGHSKRVTTLTIKIAQSMSLNADELRFIRYGSLLHDIGKMAIPDSILQKPDTLTPSERKVMELHTEYAYEWLKDVEFLLPALDVPRYHHEKWDGSGYNHGLKGEQIPLSARIFTIADIWDALTNNRIYRTAWTQAQTIDYIKSRAGKDFDPQVVEKFLEIIHDESLFSTSESSSSSSA